MKENLWYKTWFDTPYYHLLYKNRDDNEAQLFLDNLFTFIHADANLKILDLACGKGRHSIYLNQKGFNVTGADLSKESIEFASTFKNSRLDFVVHDMRYPVKLNGFDLVLNLFTSFGYFEKIEENQLVFNSVAESLRKEGLFIFDFFNAKKTLEDLVEKEEKQIDHVSFKIERSYWNHTIHKKISFLHENKSFSFEEKVTAFTASELTEMALFSGFKILRTFGNYNLDTFEEGTSERFILIAQKL